MNIVYLYQYLIDIAESDPRTKILKNPKHIKPWGFLLPAEF